MAQDGSEVRVAGNGHVYVGPVGTTLPDDTATALDADFVDLGYVTPEGVGFSFGREKTDIDAWQGDKVRVITTKQTKTIDLALMQSNKDTLVTALGGGAVTGTLGEYVFTPAAVGASEELALVVEFVDGDIIYRYVFEKVAVEGDVKFTLTRTGATTLPITFGVLAADPPYRIYTNDPAFA